MLKKLSFVIIALCMCIVTLSSVYCANVDVRKLKTGDVIYFDNSGTNWNQVKIYIFNKSDGKLNEWNNSDTMTRIGNTNIWKFEITSDMKIEEKNLDWVIFHDETNDSGEKQTIDLCYVDNIYAYKVDSTDSNDSNKRKGYWYVYDKSELQNLVEECKQYEEEYYTSDSWTGFETSLNSAKNLLTEEIKLEDPENHESGWNCKYQPAIENLKEKEKALVVDNKKLQEKIDEANKKEKEGYTKDSVDALNSAISEAEEKVKEELTVDEIKDQIKKLDDAINGLKVDKEKLKEKMQEGKDILDSDSKYYTDDSVKTLQDALNNAQNVIDNDNATVENVNDAVKQIEDAINSLDFNDKLLDDLIEKGNSTEFDKYTDETVKTLKDAIKEAEELRDSGDITVEKFKDIEKKVNDAINGLIEKTNVDNTQKEENNNSSNPNTGSYIFGVALMLAVSTAIFTYTIKYGRKVKNNN